MEDDTNDAYGTGDPIDINQVEYMNAVNDANRDWLTKEEAEIFIGRNSWFYLDKWSAHRGTRLKGWNWAAFFFSIFWMSYRRMYIEVLFLLLIVMAASTIVVVAVRIPGVSIDDRLLSSLLRLFGGMLGSLVGVYGNALYRNKALRVFRKTAHLGNVERCMALHAKGGVRIGGIICGTWMLAALFVAMAVLDVIMKA